MLLIAKLRLFVIKAKDKAFNFYKSCEKRTILKSQTKLGGKIFDTSVKKS